MIISAAVLTAGCASTYKEKPLPYKAPSSQENVTAVANARIAARAYNDAEEAREVFGFGILFFPAEAVSGQRLCLQIVDKDVGTAYLAQLAL